MIEIELEKYEPEKFENNSILCNVRKRLIHKTPEEITRQSFVKFLIQEKGYPSDRFEIEVPLSRKVKGAKGRADILVYDYQGNVLCLIECKKPNELITDIVIDQILRYNEVINAESLCVIAGNEVFFCGYNDKSEFIQFAEIPSFKTLMEGGTVEYFNYEPFEFQKFEINTENIKYIIDCGIFGENTSDKYFHFLLNLYNFYIDEEDKIIFEDKKYLDVGIKNTKYGNASGGNFFGDYRSFLKTETNTIVSFAISSMTRGENYPVFTSLMFAVEEKGHFHLSLELSVEKNIEIINNLVTITHDGKITVGKLGASKKSELIEFVQNENPELIKNGKVYLGQFNLENEIIANSEQTKSFVKNCIEYAIIRDKFRLYKKGYR